MIEAHLLCGLASVPLHGSKLQVRDWHASSATLRFTEAQMPTSRVVIIASKMNFHCNTNGDAGGTGNAAPRPARWSFHLGHQSSCPNIIICGGWQEDYFGIRKVRLLCDTSHCLALQNQRATGQWEQVIMN